MNTDDTYSLIVPIVERHFGSKKEITNLSAVQKTISGEISKLKERSQGFVRTHHHSFINSIDFCEESNATLTQVKDRLSQIENETKDKLGQTDELFDKYESLREQVAAQEFIVQGLNTLSELHNLFQQLSDDLIENEKTLSKIQHKLEDLENGNQLEREFSQTEIIISIRRELIGRKKELRERLGQQFTNIFHFDIKTHELTITSKSNDELNAFWTLLEKSKLIEDSYARFSSHLLEAIIVPIVKSISPHYDILKTDVTSIRVKSETQDKKNKKSVLLQEQNTSVPILIDEHLKVLEQLLLVDLPEMILKPSSELSPTLYRPLSQLLIHSLLVPSLTITTSRTEAIERMNKRVREFEKRLQDNGWMIDNSLQECITNIESLWADSECAEIMKWVKQVVKEPSMFVSEVVECGTGTSIENAALTLPTCSISKVARLFMLKIQRLLYEGSIISVPSSANTLFSCVRNTLDLFRILVSRNLSEKLQDMPEFAILYYTDCMYIAHVLSYATLQCSIPIEKLTLIDHVHLYRHTAQVHMQSHVTHNSKHLISILQSDRNDPFSTVPLVLETVDRLVKAYKYLPLGQRCIITGRILDSVIDYILDKIIFGIDEDVKIDRDVLDELCDEDRYQCFNEEFLIKEFCIHYEKLLAVRDVLEMRGAVEAAREYKRGGYLGEGLTTDEMERLVTILSDSRDVRNRALQLLSE